MQVSSLCLGAMMFGKWGNPDHGDCVRIVHRALDSGINFIDTADVYSHGESEEILAKALKSRRDDVVLATKGMFSVTEGGRGGRPSPNSWGGSRRHIIRACEASLRRLGTGWIDLYQLHRPDYRTDQEETLGALSDLVQQGKIRAFGSSTFPAERIVEAHWVSQRRGLERLSTEQPPYSIFVRRIERDLLPLCLAYDMGAIVWSPLNSGWLSGKYRRDRRDESTRRDQLWPDLFDPASAGNAAKYDILDELETSAKGISVPLPHLAVAWVLEHPAVTSAIIGPRTIEQLEGLLGADSLHLPVEVLDRIDELVPPGTNVRPADGAFDPPWLEDASARRRPR
jgi:aryl-alcohol dehydrogenase-like predicted oxidoreductase